MSAHFMTASNIQRAFSFLSPCVVCPQKCRVDRLHDNRGYCQTGKGIKISSFSVHHGEEPPLSGVKGAGNVFITGCNLSCVFCQNYPISQLHHGKEYTTKEVVEKFLHLQNKQKVHNIIFVTPSHVVPQIVAIIYEAKRKGLKLPVGYNSSGYDSVQSLKLLKGLIDIYLPDFKYYDDALAVKYSHAPDYREIATKAIREMMRQVGPLKIGNDGIATQGVLIRHLVLPGHTEESIRVLRYMHKHFGKKSPVSLMNQYFPAHHVLTQTKLANLNKPVSTAAFQKVFQTFQKLKMEGYYQDQGIE